MKKTKPSRAATWCGIYWRARRMVGVTGTLSPALAPRGALATLAPIPGRWKTRGALRRRPCTGPVDSGHAGARRYIETHTMRGLARASAPAPELRTSIGFAGVRRALAALPLLGVLIAVGGCGDATRARGEKERGGAAPERMGFVVEREGGGAVQLRAIEGDSVVVVDRDSLTRARLAPDSTIVRRCKRGPYTGGRIVTWCRDSAATEGRTRRH